MNLSITETNPAYFGFIKIWQTDPTNGASTLLVDKKNTILYTGADILARAVAGLPGSRISHFYVSYTNAVSRTPLPVSRTPTPYLAVNASPGGYGYGSVPLTLPPSFLKSGSDYNNNISVFTIMIPSTASVQSQLGLNFTNGVKIFEASLVAATTSPPSGTDPVFSRVQFNPVTYDSTFNLTISWGIMFTS